MESKSSSFILFLGIFVVVIVTAIQAINKTNINKQKTIVPSTGLTQEITPTQAIASDSGNLTSYDSSLFNYSFSYPQDWTLEENENSVTLKSPEYQISEGYPVLEKGASITIFVKDTENKTIGDFFDQDPLATKIGDHFSDLMVNGNEAISYDFSYEGTIATQVNFIKNGKLISISYRYPNVEEKVVYEETYLNLLDTFNFFD